MSDSGRDSLLDIFFFETNQLLEQLEQIMLNSENNNSLSSKDMDEIFRVMHTIKGSAAMMSYNHISTTAHAVEDLFDHIRQNPDIYTSSINDIVLRSLDFIKAEIEKLENGKESDGDEEKIIAEIHKFISSLDSKPNQSETVKGTTRNIHTTNIKKDVSDKKYTAIVNFEDGCMMENIHAFALVFNLSQICSEIYYRPYDIETDNDSSQYIVENGFTIYFATDASPKHVEDVFKRAISVSSFRLKAVKDYEELIKDIKGFFDANNTMTDQPQETGASTDTVESAARNIQHSLLNVNITKLDKLMDLIGEIVINESMVSKNPDLAGLRLDNFDKSAGQLRKLIDELQDNVMSIRMVPIASTFNKMRRITRDMGKKLNKDVELIIEGEDTEVDKNIVNHLSDPLMHLVRNAMDHGIELPEERVKKGKSNRGKIILRAVNTGGDVQITMMDDGKGLDTKSILEKAKEKGIVYKPEHELSEKEIFSFILHPGFSTKEEVTEFSGRGVGMDVVKRNIEDVGGSIYIYSEVDKGMMVTIKIPLTLAIIDGMKVSVGESVYIIPTLCIREFFKADKSSLFVGTEGNEMIMVKGSCYPVLRLHDQFRVKTQVTDLCEGIMILIEAEGNSVCLFADNLHGEQHVVVKPLPEFLLNFPIRKSGIGGCTILGDGSICLIMDAKSVIGSVISD